MSDDSLAITITKADLKEALTRWEKRASEEGWVGKFDPDASADFLFNTLKTCAASGK
jgi:hypothetical protein